jgi:hypothetical protein
MRINESEAVPALQVLKRHHFDQSRLAGASLSDHVHVGKPVFIFDAKEPIIIAKIDPAKMYDARPAHMWRRMSTSSPVRAGETGRCRRQYQARPSKRSAGGNSVTGGKISYEETDDDPSKETSARVDCGRGAVDVGHDLVDRKRYSKYYHSIDLRHCLRNSVVPCDALVHALGQ